MAETGLLGDPQPEIVENLLSALMFDGWSLLRLGEVNAAWRKVVGDPGLWERLNAARFGSQANPPSLVPAQPPTSIPGWCFFPGLDSGGHDCANPSDADGKLHPTDLAARAERLGAIAFNTQGWIKNALLPFFRWNRYSYIPGVGLYVREEAVARSLGKALPPPLPQQAEPEARPPDLPGWVFYQLMDCHGCNVRHPANGDDNFTSSCETLAELAEVASRLPNCVAFNTGGCLKHNIPSQVRWRQDSGPCSWSGLYVREDVVKARQLRRPMAGALIDPCLRYFQLAKTRLMAARDVDVTWLNDTYLMRVPDPSALPPAGAAGSTAAPAAAGAATPTGAAAATVPRLEVVKLNHVCWLELNGWFKGVGPGRYRCVWVLRVNRDCNVPQLSFRVTLDAARRLAGGLAPSKEVGQTDALAESAGSGADPVVRSVLDSLVVEGRELLSHAGPGWYRQSAGQFEVPPGMAYDVEVNLWDHSGSWKSGLMFKELVLRREDEPDEEEASPGPLEGHLDTHVPLEGDQDDPWRMLRRLGPGPQDAEWIE